MEGDQPGERSIEEILGMGVEFDRYENRKLNRSGLSRELIEAMVPFLNFSSGRFRPDVFIARRKRLVARRDLREKGIDVELVTHFFDKDMNELGSFAGPDYDNYNPGYSYSSVRQTIRIRPWKNQEVDEDEGYIKQE